ncbi:MAG: alpha/beta fold hydrolase [Candidatus Binataceae bacterium]
MSTAKNAAIHSAIQTVPVVSPTPVASSSCPAWVPRDLFPFQSRFMDGDVRFHYVDEGSGPTLLFLPGSPMWSFMYRHQIRALRSRYRCIAVDMPGLGLSTAPLVRGKAFERNAEYFLQFVRQLDLDDFTLIMHATAGPCGLKMALSEPSRVSSMVITNSLAWSMRDFPSMWRFVRIVSSPPFRFLNVNLNLLPRLTTRIGRNTGRFSAAERDAIRGPYRTRPARRHLANLLYGLRAEVPFFTRLESEISALKDVPVLFLYGANDHGYQAGFLDRWQQLLPNNSVTLLQGSAHFPQEDEPETYTAALADWLDARAVANRVPRLREV